MQTNSADADPRSRAAFRLAMLIKQLQSYTQWSMEGDLSQTDVTPQQMIIIKLIAHYNGQTLSQLCREMNLSKGTVSGIVHRLQEKGLVKKETLPADRRSASIVFTEQGWKFAFAIRAEMTDAFNHIFEQFSDEELQFYLKTLAEMAAKMEGTHHE